MVARKGPQLVTYVRNCVLHDGTTLDTFIDYEHNGGV
jgi:hypothetical protein